MNERSPALAGKRRVGILCGIAIFAVLLATQWPFNPWPANKVVWVPDGNGLQFERAGVVVSQGPLRLARDAPAGNYCSIELLLRPASVRVSDTVLAFYVPGSPAHLVVRQWTDGLLVTHDAGDAAGKTRQSKFDVDHSFQAGRLLLLTSGPNGTVVYRDAAHAQSFPRFTISTSELLGQIVLGTSPVDYRPWLGEIHGLAIYSKELTPAEVSRHYAEWTSPQPTKLGVEDAAIARYRFSEGAGREVHNDVVAGSNLQIPESFDVPHKPMLKSAIKEFDPNRLYFNDVVMNVAGFVPLGIILCVYFSFTHARFQAVLLATLTGALLSFVMEVLQAYVPSRTSGTTDIITKYDGSVDWRRANKSRRHTNNSADHENPGATQQRTQARELTSGSGFGRRVSPQLFSIRSIEKFQPKFQSPRGMLGQNTSPKEVAMSTAHVIIEESNSPQALSPFRTRWGSELAVHEGNPDFVLSLARGLRVIECFASQPDGLTIAEISRATALSRAAVRRLLITLELLGYIEASARKYRLQRRVPRAEA